MGDIRDIALTNGRRLLVQVDERGWRCVLYRGTTARARAKVEAVPTSELLLRSRNSSEIERETSTASDLNEALHEWFDAKQREQIVAYLESRGLL